MSFLVDKLYADLVTTDGTVCVVYVVAARWRSLHQTYAGAKILSPDGSKETQRAVGDPRDWILPTTSTRLEIRFPCEAGQFHLQYEPVLKPWRPHEPPARGLDWMVEAPRAVGQLSWPGGRGRQLGGVGYVDRVRLSRSLRRVGLAGIQWGRVHLESATLVFSSVALRAQGSWQRAVWWSHGDTDPQVWNGFKLTPERGKLLFQTHPESAQTAVTLTPTRQLQRGLTIEAVPRPRARDRALMWLLAGELLEEVWLSLGQPASNDGQAAGWAVHEAVGRGGR